MIQKIDYAAIAPVLAVALTGLLAMLVDLAAPARRAAVTWVSAAGLVVALALLVPLRGDDRATFCAPPTGWVGRRPPARCSFVVDEFTLVLQLVMLGGALAVVLMSARTVVTEALPAGEYHTLLLFSVTGAVTLAAARDLMTLVIALEVRVAAGVRAGRAAARRRRGRAESALKFFLVSVVSTSVMLYGDLAGLRRDRRGAPGSEIAVRLGGDRGDTGAVAAVGILLTLAGFAFKISAVPFHVWVPDTYVGAPVPIAAYLSVVSKAAGFAGMILVVALGFGPYADVWAPTLAVLAAASMTVGNLVALRQRHAVRLLAWSSVAQAGFILVPLGPRSRGVRVAAVSRCGRRSRPRSPTWRSTR